MTSRGILLQKIEFGLASICFVLTLGLVFLGHTALAELPPPVRAEWIDADGQVSATQWRSGSTWIWSQNHLLLQTVIEIPTHISNQLPESLATKLRGSSFKAPIPLQDDHVFLLLELKNPVTIFKLDKAGRQSLRVTVDFEHTTWMRNASCKAVNPALNELEGFDADEQAGNPDAFFISLFCRTASGGTWVEIANSEDVTLNFEPLQQTRFQRTNDGTAFWIPSVQRPNLRHLSNVTVSGANGEATAEYELVAAPVLSSPANGALPSTTSTFAESRAKELQLIGNAPLFGLQAQVMAASGSRQASRTGLAGAEIALNARIEKELDQQNHFIDFDLAIPVRRLGAGLDAKGAATHVTWLNAGYELKRVNMSWTLGAQTALLDVRSPNRTTIWSISPSVTAHFGRLYSLAIAPFDLNSGLSYARARAEWPLTSDFKNRFTVEGLLARTWIQPQKNSWDVDGLTIGFAGEF